MLRVAAVLAVVGTANRPRPGLRGGAKMRRVHRGAPAHVVSLRAGSTVVADAGDVVGVSLDFWPANKCDNGTCPWAGAS